ncbi:MinD/ParA family ATP-binding protein [Mycobacteroides abscessus]|uniref:MinD/ParA family ATP-binding protein n=2 Tax=Mycobacteroides abscessus TaxID=36809 RepID=UPI0019270730|nr:MinD/ParA family protein [Mycobacteroides abscessus]MBL3752278.1 MinD/ParA family protein [Mycobacteroides abscessus subsp. massiliense]
MINDDDPYRGAFTQPDHGIETPRQPPAANHPAPAPYSDSGGYYRPAQQAPYGQPAYPAAPHTQPPSTALVPARGGDHHVALDKADTRRRMSVPAKNGWQAALNALPWVSIGPGKDERYEISLKERVVRPVRATFTVLVLNLKGGVGKTVATKVLGSQMCSVRGDKVIAVDLDGDAGNLVDRHGRETDLSIIDLVSDASVKRYHDVRAHTSSDMVSKLEVLGQPRFADSDRLVGPDDLGRTMGHLQEYYSVVLLDCGTALKTPLVSTALGQAGALVIVTSASGDALLQTDETLEWLRHNNYQKLLDKVVLIINHTDTDKPNVVVSKVVEQFSRKIPLERIFVTPFDKHVHEGREINLELLSKKTRRRYLEIAAAVADMFPKTA